MVLALACLIVGCEEARGGGRLRSELPFAGATVIDYQARQAAAAGAKYIVILVERLPAALVAAIDRLKRDGLRVEVARSVTDAADHIHPDERLLLMADGVIVDHDTLDRMVLEPSPTVLTIADRADTQHWERIDATHRWAGLAMLDGALLRRTVEMLGEWDLQSTLLRRAVQAGAVALDAEAEDADPLLYIIDEDRTAQAIERAHAERVVLDATGWPEARLFAPVARLLAPEALMRGFHGTVLRGVGLGLTVIGLPLAVFGWFFLAALLAVLGGLVDSVGRHADGLSLGTRRHWPLWQRARLSLLAALLAIVPARLVEQGGGWGHGVVAAATLGAMLSLALQRWMGPRPPAWTADAEALVLLFAPCALIGQPGAGLALAALYAFASLIVAQWGAVRAAAAQPRD